MGRRMCNSSPYKIFKVSFKTATFGGIILTECLFPVSHMSGSLDSTDPLFSVVLATPYLLIVPRIINNQALQFPRLSYLFLLLNRILTSTHSLATLLLLGPSSL